VLLVFGAPCQLRLLAGLEHGWTIPLADIDRDGSGLTRTDRGSRHAPRDELEPAMAK